MEERTALESEIIRKCLSRSELQCSFLEYRGYKVIYRRYASLFFIIGTKPDVGSEEQTENEMGLLEFIHTMVETMDKWAGSICEVRHLVLRRACFVVLKSHSFSRISWISCISLRMSTSWWMKWFKTVTSLKQIELTFFGPLP